MLVIRLAKWKLKVNACLCTSDSDDEMIGPPMPSSMKKGQKEEEDDDMIGPPLPPGLKSAEKGEIRKPGKSNDDSDDEDGESDEDDVGRKI